MIIFFDFCIFFTVVILFNFFPFSIFSVFFFRIFFVFISSYFGSHFLCLLLFFSTSPSLLFL